MSECEVGNFKHSDRYPGKCEGSVPALQSMSVVLLSAEESLAERENCLLPLFLNIM